MENGRITKEISSKKTIKSKTNLTEENEANKRCASHKGCTSLAKDKCCMLMLMPEITNQICYSIINHKKQSTILVITAQSNANHTNAEKNTHTHTHRCKAERYFCHECFDSKPIDSENSVANNFLITAKIRVMFSRKFISGNIHTSEIHLFI